ncbi:MAG: prepilin peptidase [Desulfovibrionaceae bacterium]|jgi:leader peptidase (prepilin peptidase)/N-methyltransferase|nr:prepilin peptidase [Desulfovibrionaceae bacterium]
MTAAALAPLLAPPAFKWLALVLGLILGSFYTACVHRYLVGQSIVTPPSHCPVCNHRLAWWENIPLFSYILLRGKCSACKTPYGVRYLLIEALSGAWACALAITHGASAAFLVHMTIGGILIVAAFIDLDSYILPDRLTLGGAILAFCGSVLLLGLPLQESLIGAAAGAGLFLLLQRGYRLARGVEGLGTGDIKLMLLLGAWLGWPALPFVILVGALGGIVGGLFAMRSQPGKGLQAAVPFGPFLALGGMLYILVGDTFWAWYLN